MSASRSIVSGLLACAVALVASSGVAAQGRADESAADAKYACPVPSTAEGLAAKVAELYPRKYDKNSIGCAADLLATASKAAPQDAALNLQALLVTAEYIDLVNTLWDFDLYGVRVPEWTARLQHAIPSGKALAERALAAAPDDPTTLAAAAYFELVSVAKAAQARAALLASKQAMGELERATARQPDTLGGNALLMLGKLYYELPEFAGGNPDKAIPTLEKAYGLAPKNATVLRYLAYVYLQEREPQKARALLAQIPQLEVEPSDLQLLADELRNARDLAIRMPDAALAQAMNSKRQSLLAANPKLLTRASSASNMHGGVDPMTGKDY